MIFSVFSAFCSTASQKVCKNFHIHHYSVKMPVLLHSWYQVFLSAVLIGKLRLFGISLIIYLRCRLFFHVS